MSNMDISVSQETIYKHFVSVDQVGAPFTSSHRETWEKFAIQNHRERDGGISWAQATDNTLIVLTRSAWSRLAKNHLFSCSQAAYYEKVADPASPLRLALNRNDVKGYIITTRTWTGYEVTEIKYGGTTFALEANFTTNGFEVMHLVGA